MSTGGSGLNAQRMDALAIANEVRARNKAIKAEVTAGRLTLAEALEDPRAGGIAIYMLLMAQPGCGKVKTRQLLHRNLIWSGTKTRDLTARQRQLLIDAMS